MAYLKLTRRDDWHPRLLDYVHAQERTPFNWGQSDCLLFVAGAIEAMTGEDVAAPYRGKYSSFEEARALLGKSTLSFVRSQLREREHQTRAMGGDIGAKKEGGDWTYGVFVGPYLYVKTADGVGILPRSEAQKAFEV
ncbi:hypothetical protein JJB09_18625 [Rhizobium sp. KVB221]|uniref:DUF6950 domain-containing protein n=1 Tax=Rhizobium setariae TaxID=2801340 RepID=A0A936YVU1_9HYPH|nr:hypothetical protein [Rhizobium setariae]MBL0374040.1 hypothetical protein [Rhizobium setariae]